VSRIGPATDCETLRNVGRHRGDKSLVNESLDSISLVGESAGSNSSVGRWIKSSPPHLYPSGIPINRLSSRNTPTTKAPMSPRSIEVLSLSGRCFHRSKSRSHHLSSPSPSRSSTLPPRPNPVPTCVSARMLDHFSPRRGPEARRRGVELNILPSSDASRTRTFSRVRCRTY
jgi:hypothetical protein